MVDFKTTTIAVEDDYGALIRLSERQTKLMMMFIDNDGHRIKSEDIAQAFGCEKDAVYRLLRYLKSKLINHFIFFLVEDVYHMVAMDSGRVTPIEKAFTRVEGRDDIIVRNNIPTNLHPHSRASINIIMNAGELTHQRLNTLNVYLAPHFRIVRHIDDKYYNIDMENDNDYC